MAFTVSNVVTEAYQELGIAMPGDSLPGEWQTIGLARMNRLLDEWNATRLKAYQETFNEYTLFRS